jgi:hypothetical protein
VWRIYGCKKAAYQLLPANQMQPMAMAATRPFKLPGNPATNTLKFVAASQWLELASAKASWPRWQLPYTKIGVRECLEEDSFNG